MADGIVRAASDLERRHPPSPGVPFQPTRRRELSGRTVPRWRFLAVLEPDHFHLFALELERDRQGAQKSGFRCLGSPQYVRGDE